MFEKGEQPPHSVSFRSPEQLRKLLTPRWFEVLHSIKREPPESLRALSERLDRSPGDVFEDAQLLSDYGIVYFRKKVERNSRSSHTRRCESRSMFWQFPTARALRRALELVAEDEATNNRTTGCRQPSKPINDTFYCDLSCTFAERSESRYR